MTRCWRHCGFKWALANWVFVGGVIATSGDCALAQVTPDGTLPNNSIVTPQGNTSIINGGTQAGSNLFHSFEQFSITTGGAAYFNNALDIQNIFSRVTGGSISNIDGLIRANASANLFLLNPNGIIFGPNASLDVRGSFVASTASSLNFADGKQFSATPPQTTTPLLTVSVPIGLQFGGTAEQIHVRGPGQSLDSDGFVASFDSSVGLQVLPGKTLALVGGDVSLNGGILQAPGGRVELGGLVGTGTVGLNVDGNNLRLSFPDSVARANVFLTNRAGINVVAGGGGSIAVNAQDLDVLGGSRFSAGIGERLGSVSSQAGDITLDATRAIRIKQSSGIENIVNPNAIGNGADITIRANSLSFADGSRLISLTNGKGNAGSVTIEASGPVSFGGGSSALTFAGSDAVGKGGDITIRAGSLSFSDGSGFLTSTSGRGDAGSVTFEVSGPVALTGVDANGFPSGVFSNSESVAVGKGGDITIRASSLSLRDGAQLVTSTIGQGDAGSVRIEASGPVSLTGVDSVGVVSGIFSNVASFSAEDGGDGGDITIGASSLTLSDAALLSTNTKGQGNAGSVTIEASGSVSFAGVDEDGVAGGVLSSVDAGAVGNGGDIKITAGLLSVTSSAQLQASTAGSGNAGKVSIDVHDAVTLSGVNNDGLASGVFSTVEATATGINGNSIQGGNIDIQARSLSLSDGAQLRASTAGQGNAGKISVNTANAVSVSGTNSGFFTNTNSVGKGGNITVDTNGFRLSDNAVLNAEASDVGDGGNIQVNAKTFDVSNGAGLNSNTSGQGNAGSVTVRAPESVRLIGTSVNNQPSGLFTETKGAGAGGSLQITTGQLQVLDGAQVSASTHGLGPGGTLYVIAPTGLVELIGSQSRLTTETLGTEAAGNLTITTLALRVQDGARISASTSGSGQGGSLSVTAPESVILSGMGSLSAQATANGNAGGLTINTPALTVEDGAEVSAATTSGVGGDITLAGLNSLQLSNGGNISASTQTGRAGSVSVNGNSNAASAVQLRGQGSGLFARATGGGDAGGLTINALALTVADGAEATVSSQQGQAGNLRVTANSIFLDRGRLSAVTAKSQPRTEGANITLQVPDLLLMGNESRISADALETANGGNINIDADFLIALPPTGPSGSDIRANAFQGNGGKLNINADGIFGIAFRPRESRLNDITARSEFGDAGEVTFNTPDVDPSLGLVALPAELVDASGLIAQTCPAGGGQGQSKFTVTGRGGLPENPSDSLSSDAVEVDLVTLNPKVENRSSPNVSTLATSVASAPIVEAQGWVIGANGEVILTATAPTVTPHSPGLPTQCHTLKSAH